MLDRCLDELGLCIRARAIHTEDPGGQLLSRRNVQSLVTCVTHTLDEHAWGEVEVFVAQDSLGILPAPITELEVSSVQAIAASLARLKLGDPLHTFAEQVWIARRASWTDGYFGGALSAAQTVGKVLLNSVLLLIQSEKITDRNLTHRQLEEEGLAKRVRSYHAPDLVSNWNVGNPTTAVGRWSRFGKFRRRVVHTGYLPTENEVLEASVALDQLEAFGKQATHREAECLPKDNDARARRGGAKAARCLGQPTQAARGLTG